jgi:glycosyltransferase involved in cell wall biosynthesis
MKTSILTPLHKSNEYLDDYFNTIFNQTILPDEIILIDDTKNHPNLNQIIENKKLFYKFNNILLIKNNINLGPTESLNKGIKFCNYKLIFRLDVDDLWHPKHICKMLSYYRINKKYLIYANSLSSSNFINKIISDDYLINGNHFVHSSWLINRNVCRGFKYFVNYKFEPEDYATLKYYIKKNYNFFFTNELTAFYKNNSKSYSKISQKNIFYEKNLKKISKELFFFYYKIYKVNNLQFSFIKFIFFKLGFAKFLVFIFISLDIIKLRLFYRILFKNRILIKKN